MTTITSHYHDKARAALEASGDSLFIRWHDEDIGETVAPILGGEHQDPVHRSNLEAALELLAEHVENGDVHEGTVGRSGATWLTLLQVRVLDENGELTQAWIDTVDRVLDPLEDYPLLNEERHSELEFEELDDTVRFWAGNDALADLALHYLSIAGDVDRSDEFDGDDAARSIATEVWADRDARLAADDGENDAALEALAGTLRDAARHDRYGLSARFFGSDTAARHHARALVAEVLADRIDPEVAA